MAETKAKTDDGALDRLKKAGFTSTPISYERVQRLQEELDLHVSELGKLMGQEWVVLTAYLLGEAASSRGLAADLLGEVAAELKAPGLEAPGARVTMTMTPIAIHELKLPPTKPSATPAGAKKRAAKKKRGKRP